VDFAADHRRLVAIALQSFTAIKTGNIGPGGATGDLLTLTLKELNKLTDRLQPAPSVPLTGNRDKAENISIEDRVRLGKSSH
jgi:hypothetical protein